MKTLTQYLGLCEHEWEDITVGAFSILHGDYKYEAIRCKKCNKIES